MGALGIVSLPITVEALQEVRGEIICANFCNPYIQDPMGNKIFSLSGVKQSNFLFVADMKGRYSFVVENTHTRFSDYQVSYTILTRFDTPDGSN